MRKVLAWSVVLALCAVLLAGCGAKPIDESVISYFRGLEGLKYWATVRPIITVNGPDGSTEVFSSIDDGEKSVEFGAVKVLEQNQEGRPIKAVITAMVREANETRELSLYVSQANQDSLASSLTRLETDAARTKRLEEEKRRKQEEERKRQEIERRMNSIKSQLRKDYDEFRQITFLEHKQDPNTLSREKPYFFPYIGYDQSGKWMFARARIFTEEWIFMEQVMVVIGNRTYSTPVYPSYSDLVTHDVWTGGVFERIDFRWSDSEVEELGRAIADAPLGTTIKVRFAGSRRNFDFTLSRSQHQAWKDMIFYYDHLEVGTK